MENITCRSLGGFGYCTLKLAGKRLNMIFDRNEMECLLIVGLWCTNPNNKERPDAGEVIKVLQLEASMPELQADSASTSRLGLPRISNFQHQHRGSLEVVTATPSHVQCYHNLLQCLFFSFFQKISLLESSS